MPWKRKTTPGGILCWASRLLSPADWLLVLKDMQAKPVGDVFHGCHGGDAVPKPIQRRTVQSNAHGSFDGAHQSAAHTALVWNTNPDAKFAGEIIHAAGEHNAFQSADIARGNPMLSGKGIHAPIG